MSTAIGQRNPNSSTDLVRFHLSLNVDDLARSVAFFEILFDVGPVKREIDYAKFEIDEPPLVLSLEPNRAPRGGKLNHLGFRLTSREALVAMQKRLEMHGAPTERDEGVECCYSRQTKFWLNDPDGNLWEIYTLEDDLDHRGMGQAYETRVSAEPAAAAPAIWAHRLGEAFPPNVMVESDGVDEVLLQGTFNAQLPPDEPRRILTEALRILKPGAQITLHQLTARSSLESLSQPLPGPAAAVQAVPSAERLIDELEAAGFVDLHFEKLGQGPCFMADGVECRETKLVGLKPHPRSVALLTYQALYKGPFRAIEDDRGQTFRRGQWTTVDAATWQHLQSAAHRDQFVLITKP
ncbi:MAG TPA: ArsI/CadI family heavy metal resistance metalloenzyme [Pirellulales bacterium]|jgi:catechol 2,3-dioxygenase-like lactoylglutathione lyase family enzyme|nr:ArsI/CadI family heavy metal resistance metalloenzyme [Pirellulales bacterium]